jgi:Cof subfamily protein (haloacid dehalogenase superfamily)
LLQKTIRQVTFVNIRLIVTDLDDTLLRDDQTISDRSVATIRRATQRGITLAIATGRMFPSALPYARLLGLSGPILCCQGAQIADIESGGQISVTTVPQALAQDMLHFAEDKGLYIQYYSTDHYYFEKTCDQSEYYRRTAGVTGIALGRKASEALDFEPIKMLIIADPSDIRAAYDEAVERWGGKLEIAISRSNYLEITHPEANKGAAMALLAERMGIPLEQVMAVGDALNDLPMIRRAGFGVAVANASEQVKGAADAMTGSNREDGVAQAIEQYVLGE